MVEAATEAVVAVVCQWEGLEAVEVAHNREVNLVEIKQEEATLGSRSEVKCELEKTLN